MLVIELKALISSSKFSFGKKELTTMMKEIYISECSQGLLDNEFTEQKYNNLLKKCWNNLNEKMRSLYDFKQLVAYDKKQDFEYFIYKDIQDGLVGNESKTLSIIILTQGKQIEHTISSVYEVVKKKVKKAIKFQLLIPSKCKIYAYDYLTKDIHGDNYVIETDLEKKSFISKSESIKFIITLFLFLVSSSYLFSKWEDISVGASTNNNGVEYLFNLPLIVNLIAGTALVLLIDLIYFLIRRTSDKNMISIRNIQGVIDSFDNSLMLGQQQAVEDMQEEIEVI